MVKVIAPVLAVFAIVMFAATGSMLGTASTDDVHRPDVLTTHEWGTFTTVAGVDGKPIDWLPLAGPNDLPCFVEHFGDSRVFKIAPSSVLTYTDAATRLKGKVRMETPVLYFYSPREENLQVKVHFEGGLFSEWYPHANVSQMAARENLTDGAGADMQWNGVRVLPGAESKFPTEGRPSHYYAARQTDASPIQVAGKDEKFLFYRGLGSFAVPMTAEVTPDGKIMVTATGNDPVQTVALFENRGGKIGYRLLKRLGKGTVTWDRPQLGSDFASLQSRLESVLVESGLYPKEAHAMVETWRDSWFEEGTRIFYILPQSTVDHVLPLTITPVPAHVVRTFVGRMEVIMPDMVRSVETAIATDDAAALKKYGRFLGPIAGRLASTPKIQELVDSTYKSYVSELSAACK
jgi:hypothetical protein